MSALASDFLWLQKANAVLMLCACTALFAVTVVWPVASPFVPPELAPDRLLRAAWIDIRVELQELGN